MNKKINWKSLQKPIKGLTEKQKQNPKTVMVCLGLALHNALGIDSSKLMIPKYDGVIIT